MSSISAAFDYKKAFVAYLMAGDPDLEKTRTYLLSIAKAGAGLIELGIPFSDPIAEGEIIQQANLRAFASNTNIHAIFDMVQSLKGKLQVPLLFMTYVNPVFNYGYDRFFEKCAQCGVSGIIFPDLPFEEQDEVRPFCDRHGVTLITLVAPTSEERIARIAQNAQGFIYLVSSLGVTGLRNEITTDIAPIIADIRRYTQVPIAVGFGVHTQAQARILSRQADGIIVGSAIVDIIRTHPQDASPYLEDYISAMAAAIL
jgi:tryptophan synthase alpha chain